MSWILIGIAVVLIIVLISRYIPQEKVYCKDCYYCVNKNCHVESNKVYRYNAYERTYDIDKDIEELNKDNYCLNFKKWEKVDCH